MRDGREGITGAGRTPSRPGWGHQTGFFQRRQPALWLFLLLLLTGPIFLLVQVVYAATDPLGWLLACGLMLVYVVPVVLIVRWLDLYEREPRSLVIAAFLWGAVVAVIFSSFGNVIGAPSSRSWPGRRSPPSGAPRSRHQSSKRSTRCWVWCSSRSSRGPRRMT